MSDMPQVSVQDLDDEAVLLDVREHEEYDLGHAPRAIHIPLGELESRLSEVPDVEQVDVVCRSGKRSARAVAYLREQGRNARNVEGGMTAWHAAGKQMVAMQDSEPTVL